jgi:small subunit ribosomal protein S17
MQDENEQQNEQTEPEAEAPEQESPAAEEEQAEAPAAEEPAGEAPAAEEPAEEPEVLSPKQRRKQTRARATGPAQPQRGPEDRARERREARSQKAAERGRWRAHRGEKRKAAGPAGAGRAAEPAGADREAGKRKVRQGVVVSNKGDKTITVRIDRVGRHRVYGRVIRSTGTLHAHDEQNQAGEGDTVRVMECRPLSRTKRWRLVEILEKAK